MKTKTVYEAEDGKEFESEQACLDYECKLAQDAMESEVKLSLVLLVEKKCWTDCGEFNQDYVADFILECFDEIESIVNKYK